MHRQFRIVFTLFLAAVIAGNIFVAEWVASGRVTKLERV